MMQTAHEKLIEVYATNLASESSCDINSPALVKAYACSLLIESTLTSWFVLWESGSLPVDELYVFYDKNFDAPVKSFASCLERIDVVYPGHDNKLIQSMLGFIVAIKSNRVDSYAELNPIAVRSLLASMLITQSLRPTDSGPAGFDVRFEKSSRSISSLFLSRCLAKDEKLSFSDEASCRSLALHLLSD
jgi:hypothetical protein